MMKIETIRGHMEKALEKEQKKLATIQRKQKTIENKRNKIASGKLTPDEVKWTQDDIHDLENDIVRLQNEADQARESADKYARELELAEIREKSRNCKPILDFLERWKDMMANFYHQMAHDWAIEGRELEEKHEREMEALKQKVDDWKVIRKLEKEQWEEEKELTRSYACIHPYKIGYWADFEEEKMIRDLEHEAKMRYDQLIERVTEICGEIVDASHLGIGEKGDLEGYVIGTKGKAEVFTIGAGGYNIQCYHYRTLVKERA